MNTIEIQEKIREEFKKSNKIRRNIKLPKTQDIGFVVEDNIVKIKLSEKCVLSNMQSDIGAFDGWAIVLKRWGNYDKVIVTWDIPAEIENGHYQRFLFRIKNFYQDYKSWFSIDEKCIKLLDGLTIKDGNEYFLNIPGNRQGSESIKGEAVLEERLVNGDLKDQLKKITSARMLDKQLPVGVFDGPVSKVTSIFTRGKSAIDIWGLNSLNELLLFELKTGSNYKVGIISELYFYVSVMKMVQKRVFKYGDEKIKKENVWNNIPKTKNIKAYFLSPNLHPLIDNKVLELLNQSDKDHIKVNFIVIQIIVDKLILKS